MKATCKLCFTVSSMAVLVALPMRATAEDEADRAALRAIKATYEDAVNSGDLSKIAPHLEPNVTGVMVTGEAVEGLPGLEAYYKKIQALIGPGGSYRVKVNVDKTEFFPDLAISRGNTEDVVRLPNGKELNFSSLWTAVCHKSDGKWKVLRMQASMDPVQNVFTAMSMKGVKLIYAVGGFAIGLAVALVARVVLRRGGSTKTAA